MDQLPIFCFALKPFSLGVSGLTVLVGRLTNGDFETYSLCVYTDGQADASRLEFLQAVGLADVIDAAQYDARELMPNPHLPVSWIQTADTTIRTLELSEVFGAVTIALRSVKSPELRDVLARVVPAKASV